MKKLYHNIITSVYDKFAWLGNFIDIHFFESVDSINEGRNEEKHDTFIDFYCRKIAFLLDLLQRFQPDTTDDSIRNICEYILNNSEEDLKLKVIAEKFYLNNTYLSNTFAAKTHIHFNNYVTMVKMARAKYLFLNTELKTYEVAYRIGYRDINYFSKLFKKKYGKSPGEYQSTAYDNYQIKTNDPGYLLPVLLVSLQPGLSQIRQRCRIWDMLFLSWDLFKTAPNQTMAVMCGEYSSC